MIGICSTGLTETKGDDVDGYIKLFRQRHPEADDTAIVYVSTPDYVGAFQDGWGKAVTALVDTLAEPAVERDARRIAVLPGCHLTPGDIEEVRALVEAFGLTPVFVPDLSGSLDGHMSDEFSPTTHGGTSLHQVRAIGGAGAAPAIGEHMRAAAMRLQEKCGVPFVLFDRVTGLTAVDRLVAELARLSGRAVPAALQRQRSQLQDAMLDAHFFVGGKRFAIGAEPDLLWAIGLTLREIGAECAAAVTTTASPLLQGWPGISVPIGDLEDLERAAAGCDLLLTHSHGRQAAARLDIPFVRIGLPMFDRLGAAHVRQVGYRGTRDLIFAVGNTFLAEMDRHHADPDSWQLPESTLQAVREAAPSTVQ